MCWSLPKIRNGSAPIKLLSPQICIRLRASERHIWGDRSLIGALTRCSSPASSFVTHGESDDPSLSDELSKAELVMGVAVGMEALLPRILQIRRSSLNR